VLYVDEDFGADPARAVSHSQMLDKLLDAPVVEFIGAFAKLARFAGDRTCVFSTEGLCMVQRVERYASRFGLLRQMFDIKVVFYVRNQSEVFYSGWQQWGAELDFDDWVEKALRERRADWGLIGTAWAGAVGAENVDAVVFRSDNFPEGDVVRDFCARTGIPYLPSRPNRIANPTLPDVTVLALQHVARERQMPVQGLIRHLKRTPGYTFPPRQNLVFGPEAQARIEAAYAGPNATMFRLFGLDEARQRDYARVAIGPRGEPDVARRRVIVKELVNHETFRPELKKLRQDALRKQAAAAKRATADKPAG
jgi:hypothetical protein